MAYKLNRTGDNVSDLLTQVADKSIYPDATQEAHGLLSAADKAKLDALPDVVYGTTSYWNSQITYVPPQGKVVVYADYNSKIVDGHTVYIPSIKIGTGLAFLHELPFVGDVSIYGLGAAAYKDVVSTVTSVSTDLPTSSAVHSAIGDTKSELEQEITSVAGDVSELSTKLTNAEGDITDLQVDARGIHTDIRSINEDVAHLDLRADALELDMSNAKGDINQLEVTATGLRQDVSNAQGDIHTLESTASSLESNISAVDGRVSTLSQTVDGISATVRGQGQDIAGLAIEAHRIDLYAQSVNESLGDYETYTNGILRGLQKQIDGVVDTYFYDYMPVEKDATGAPDSQVPLLVIEIEGHEYPCEPYASWYNTDHGGTAQEVNTERIKHLGDVFYDNKSGYAFRFSNTGTEQNPVFAWVEIQDSAVIKALADAARAQDTADHKRRVFVYSQDYPTPYAPYDVGDLWVKDIEVYVPPRGSSIVGTTINTRMLYKCRTARARTSNVFPYNPDVNVDTSRDTCDWEPANDNPLEIANANLQLLSDAIVGKVGAYTYDSNGVLTVTSQSLIQQQAHSIILEVTGDELETVGIYINNVSAADNSIVLKADKVYIKGAGSHDATALSVMYDSTTDRYKINTDSLNVDGIFSTSPGSVWATQLTNIKGYADDAANNAYNNAVSQAATNAADYITLNVVPQITAAQNTADSAQAGVTGMQYLANALGNGTTAIGGGLILTSLVGLGGNSGTGGAWELWSGINGQYSSSDPGHGVGAWYGGSGDSNGNYIDCITIPNWATMTTSERLAAWDTYRYGRSLFRLDGSGYLASGAITWGASGDLHLMDNIYIGAGTSNPFGEYLTFLTKLATWFEDVEETIGGVSRRMLRINMNGTAAGGTDFAGLEFNGFLLTGGDQIVGSGTPGGGGGGGASYLHELLDVEYGLNPSPDDLLIYSNSVSLNPDGTTTGPGWTTIAKSSVGKIYTAGTGISIDNNDAINLATSGVTAGTYHSVTVDTYGRVTSGSNPATVDSVSLAQGATNGTLHLTVNGTAQTDIAVPGWSSKADASALNDYFRWWGRDAQNSPDNGAGYFYGGTTGWWTYGPGIAFGRSDAHVQIQGDYYTSALKVRSYIGDTASFSSWETIWTSGNDGSGSGLDADTLDSHDSTYFVNALAYNNFAKTFDAVGYISSADYNYDSSTPSPFGLLGGNACTILQVIPGGGTWSAQYAFGFHSGKIAWRNKENSAEWSDWKNMDYLLLTGGTMSNTNLVTNLNADLLDGYNESSFVGNNRGYLTDFNIAYGSSVHFIAPDCANGPGGANYGQALIIHSDGDTTAQLAFPYPVTTGFLRCGNNNGSIWQNWREFAFLDSNVASATNATYATYDSAGNQISTYYLPLAGGTMSNTNVVTNLDADLLDGLHASGFLRNYGLNPYTYSSDISSQGTCTLDTGYPETPDNSYNTSYLTLGEYSAPRLKQLAFCYDTDNIFYRRNGGNGWTSWVKLWNSSNSNLSTVAWNCSTLTTANNITINSPDWVNSYGIHINEGGVDSYGFDIMYGAGDNFSISRRSSSTTPVAVMEMARDSSTTKFSGSVGIGIWPSYTLHVSGTIASTGDQIITSDVNKKTNFQDLTYTLEQIANAPAITFDWKDGSGHSFGSIAQYWKPICPEMVLGEEGNYTLAYAQGAFVNAIINARAIVALQDHETEQDKEIRELKEALGRANKKIEGLEKEVERLRIN